MNIKESEKDGVIAAVSDINRSIENLKNNYAVKDPQDLIAMTALQLVMKSDSNAKSVSTDESSNSMDLIEKALADLSDKLDVE